MSIIKRNPVFPGNLLDEWLYNFPTNWGKDEQYLTSTPAANITETAEAYHIDMNVPGRNKEEFTMQAENGLLTIRYEKKEEKLEKEVKTIRREFAFQSFKVLTAVFSTGYYWNVLEQRCTDLKTGHVWFPNGLKFS